MIKHVLFIQGAGQGAYEEDKKLATSLQETLGAGYEIRYPAMPDEGNAPYEQWKRHIVEELATMQGPIILVGHSVGGSVLAKCLSEIEVGKPVVEVILMATPFWGGDGWRYEGYEELELPQDVAVKFPRGPRPLLYHCRDDETVPFDHLALFAKVLPHAHVRELDNGGHQFSNDMSIVAKDIESLEKERIVTWLAETFGTEKPVIGMIHLPPLPGTALYDDARGMAGIVESAKRDAEALQAGGITAVMFGNEGDRPYRTKVGPETVAAVAAAVAAVAPGLSVPFGVDVLWDPRATLAVAKATGARFAREVFAGLFGGDLGLWETAAGEVFQYRRAIDAQGVRLLFTINAEFAAPVAPRPIAAVARSVAFSSLPDALCVSGPLTGSPAPFEELRAAKEAAGETPIFANTGVRRETIAETLTIADGCIVGTALKVDGITWNAVDPARVRGLMAAAQGK